MGRYEEEEECKKECRYEDTKMKEYKDMKNEDEKMKRDEKIKI